MDIRDDVKQELAGQQRRLATIQGNLSKALLAGESVAGAPVLTLARSEKLAALWGNVAKALDRLAAIKDLDVTKITELEILVGCRAKVDEELISYVPRSSTDQWLNLVDREQHSARVIFRSDLDSMIASFQRHLDRQAK